MCLSGHEALMPFGGKLFYEQSGVWLNQRVTELEALQNTNKANHLNTVCKEGQIKKEFPPYRPISESPSPLFLRLLIIYGTLYISPVENLNLWRSN